MGKSTLSLNGKKPVAASEPLQATLPAIEPKKAPTKAPKAPAATSKAVAPVNQEELAQLMSMEHGDMAELPGLMLNVSDEPCLAVVTSKGATSVSFSLLYYGVSLKTIRLIQDLKGVYSWA